MGQESYRSLPPRRAPVVPESTGRRGRYAATVLLAVLVFGGANFWPGWQIVPFLDPSTVEVLGIFNASLIVIVIVNAVNVVADRPTVTALGEIVTSVVGLVVVARFWVVFPFDFDGSGFNLGLMFGVLLILACAGYVISIMVQIAALLRLASGLRLKSTERTERTECTHGTVSAPKATANNIRSHQCRSS